MTRVRKAPGRRMRRARRFEKKSVERVVAQQMPAMDIHGIAQVDEPSAAAAVMHRPKSNRGSFTGHGVQNGGDDARARMQAGIGLLSSRRDITKRMFG